MKLEKQADILIADDARTDGPEGSISWKFIQASVAEGQLEDMTKYPGVKRRTTQSQAPKRQTARRHAFTAEDDHVLAEWVLKAQRSGEPIMGNSIYMKLAKVVYSACCDSSLAHESTNHIARMTGIPSTRGGIVGLRLSLNSSR